MQNRDTFRAAGGKEYAYIPCLNDDAGHIGTLASLVAQHCQGWPEASPGYDAAALADERRLRQIRANALSSQR